MIDRTKVTLPAEYSARTALGRNSLIRVAAFIATLTGLAVALPEVVLPTLTGIVAVLYVLSAFDRNRLLLRGLRESVMVRIDDDDALAVPDRALPVYTVLLPVYNEPSIVENLINGVGRLNYPSDKLEVLLLIEEDDTATAEALVDLPMESIRVVVVPDSLPKTKPKACNHGMRLPDLRGELVTIYDAEDVPDPLQLRRAAMAFSRAAEDVGCLQGRLGYFNETQNLLTRWFSLEYDQWFGVVLPAVHAANGVVLLGGTSNHMRTSVWQEVGGWDEFNVTEDADLGVRLARHGYRTMILDSVTLEEANSDVINWIRQRSRWYKGYLQTMIVFLRHPLQLRREIGTKAVLRLINMTGGVPLMSIINLFFWTLLALWLTGRPDFVNTLFPPTTYYVCLALFLIVSPMSVYIGLIAAQSLGKPHLWWAALLIPGYWALQSVAAVKAVYQLIFRPFFWEKTVHGLTENRTTQHVRNPAEGNP